MELIYTASNEAAAPAALDDLTDAWGGRSPAIIWLWNSAWAEFVPFLDYNVEIRAVICSTDAIESLNSRYRRAVKARGHFPTEQAAMKCLYLVTPGPDRARPGTMDHEGNQRQTRSPPPSPTAGPAAEHLLMNTA